MSPQSSDSMDLFDSTETEPVSGGLSVPVQTQAPDQTQVSVPPQARQAVKKRPFDVYSLMLILSFLMLTAAAILLYSDTNKY